MQSGKPRVIKDYEKLSPEIQERIKLEYPRGFKKHLISFTNKEGKKVSALPFETEDRYYLVRMTVSEAQIIIEQDDDFDEYGMLKDEIKDEYTDKYEADDLDNISEEDIAEMSIISTDDEDSGFSDDDDDAGADEDDD